MGANRKNKDIQHSVCQVFDSTTQVDLTLTLPTFMAPPMALGDPEVQALALIHGSEHGLG